MNNERLMDTFITLAIEKLQAPRIYTSTYAELGGVIVAKLRAQKRADNKWNARSFDIFIEEEKRTLDATGKLRSSAHPDNWVRTYFFVKLCKEIGVKDPEKVPYGKILSPIFGAAFFLNKERIKAKIKLGWESWLLETIPLQYPPRPMTKTELLEDIDDHRLFLPWE
jgi:hypothetical protein